MMDFGERLYRARIHAAWSHYRSAPHLPMHREFARHEVAKSIAALRELLNSRGANTHRPADWHRVYERKAA